MGDAYRVYTIVSGQVSEGAMVEKFALRGAGVDIPAIMMGQSGRGRSLGILPVFFNASLFTKNNISTQLTRISFELKVFFP